MKKFKSGFTIVELLIVIVIIAILSTLVFTAYRGLTDRSRNAQTMSAAEQWYKGLEMYKARNGSYPNAAGCLGNGYGWTSTNISGAAPDFQCRQDTSMSGVRDNATLNTALSKYVTGSPAPAMITAISSTTLWKRGISYYNANPARLDVVLAGQLTTCPKLGKISANPVSTYTNGNVVCPYTLGPLSTY